MRAKMDDQIDRRQLIPSRVTTKDLAGAASQPVTDYRRADLAAGGHAQPRSTLLVGSEVEDSEAPVPTLPFAIAAKEVAPLPETVLATKTLTHRRDLWCAHHTVRRLRPFLRRRARMARPRRVRILDRKPCFFFRRRLFGW
jgi:hypothetical protein